MSFSQRCHRVSLAAASHRTRSLITNAQILTPRPLPSRLSNTMSYLGNLSKLFNRTTHLHCTELNVPSSLFKMQQLVGSTECSTVLCSTALNLWSTKEIYASTIIHKLFPTSKYSNLQNIILIPDWFDTDLSEQRVKFKLASSKTPSASQTSEGLNDKYCEDSESGYKKVDFFFLAAVLKRFPKLQNFDCTFDLEVADLFSTEFTNDETLQTLSKSVTSINLNKKMKWNQWGHFLGGVLDDFGFRYFLGGR